MDYQSFWRQSLPEYVLPREDMLSLIQDKQSFSSQEYLRDYQDRVSSVYGAYEPEEYQLKMLEFLLPALDAHDGDRHLVSFGCGPGVLECWLLKMLFIDSVVAFDLSPKMIERAGKIAAAVGVSQQVEFSCLDVASDDLPALRQADAVISINALHWSSAWREWIARLISSTKRGGLIFLTCTLGFPQSQINEQQLIDHVRGCVKRIDRAGFMLEPVRLADGRMARNPRYVVIAHK